MKTNRLLLIVVAALNFIGCSNNEPWSIIEEDAIRNSTDVNYTQPIVFETESMKYYTEYDINKNIHTTPIMIFGTNRYRVNEDYAIPDAILIKKIIVEQDGKFEALNLSDYEEAIDAATGFFKYSNSLLKFSYIEKGVLDVTLETSRDEYEYRKFHIYLENSNGTIGTKIVINDSDKEIMLGGWSNSIDFDMSQFEFPYERDYHIATGENGDGSYTIYVPAEECEFELPTTYIYDIYSIRLDDKIDGYLYLSDPNNESKILSSTNPSYTITLDCGEFTLTGILKKGVDEFKQTILKCKIFKNTTGKERKIGVVCMRAYDHIGIYIVQSAE